MAKNTTVGKGSGQRRRYRGRMVLPNGSPRAHTHGGHSQAWAGFTCGDTALSNPKQQQSSSAAQAPYKVAAPTKKEHRHGTFGSIATLT